MRRSRWLFSASLLAAIVLLATLVLAQAPRDIQRGVVRRIDAAKGTVTIGAADGEREYPVVAQTRLWGTRGQTSGTDLAGNGFRVGSAVMFRAGVHDGRLVLEGLRLFGPPAGEAPRKVDTSAFKPLPELGTGRYLGFEGGLYSGGSSTRPRAHEQAGVALARTVRPLDAQGKPDPGGRIVLLSIGMSNTTQEFQAFQRLAPQDPQLNPRLTFVDGAQGGQTARIIQTEGRYWQEVDRRLGAAGVSPQQVQAIWLKEADARPTDPFPKHARDLQTELANIVRLARSRYPNLKLAYLSSRTYGGYARTLLNPEPYAYESGFAVKWLIEQQVGGDATLAFSPAAAAKAPWLSWGPYLWANGTKKNADGLSYEDADFGPDGTHPADTGRRKVAEALLRFLKTDATTKGWFLR